MSMRKPMKDDSAWRCLRSSKTILSPLNVGLEPTIGEHSSLFYGLTFLVAENWNNPTSKESSQYPCPFHSFPIR